MGPADAALVALLPGYAFAAMLVLARVGGAIMLLPALGEATLPTMVRAAIAAALTALLTPVLLTELPPSPGSPWGAFAMIGAELVTGLWFGWLARLVVIALPMGGDVISAMLGLSNVILPGPSLGSESVAFGALLGIAVPTLLLVTGLYTLPLAALADSYRVIPAGTLLPASGGALVAMHAVATSFALAIRIAAPFLLASLVWQIALGLASRLVPQIPIYFISLPGQIVGGLALLAVLAATLLTLWLGATQAGFHLLPGAN